MKLPIEPDLWTRLIVAAPEGDSRSAYLQGSSAAVSQFVEDGTPLVAFCLDCVRECMMSEAFETRLLGALVTSVGPSDIVKDDPLLSAARLGWMNGMLEISRIIYDLGQQEAVAPLDLIPNRDVVNRLYWVALSGYFFTEMIAVLDLMLKEMPE